MLTGADVAKHSTKDDLWMIIHGKVCPLEPTVLAPDLVVPQLADPALSPCVCVIRREQVYDLTSFAPEHPGGMKILLKYGGKDATAEFVSVAKSLKSETRWPGADVRRTCLRCRRILSILLGRWRRT